jgi:small nuclear ribonucleoprotein (snRNP)-like protein
MAVKLHNFILLLAAFMHSAFFHLMLLINSVGTVTVLTNDGRHLVGTLRGYDQATNLILDECHERVYQEEAGVESIVLGLYVVRGDNM